jgi:hypothetical protein
MMQSFEPMPGFVDRVMNRVHETEKAAKPRKIILATAQSACARFGLATGAVFLGVFNLVRLYLIVFAPTLCR